MLMEVVGCSTWLGTFHAKQSTSGFEKEGRVGRKRAKKLKFKVRIGSAKWKKRINERSDSEECVCKSNYKVTSNDSSSSSSSSSSLLFLSRLLFECDDGGSFGWRTSRFNKARLFFAQKALLLRHVVKAIKKRHRALSWKFKVHFECVVSRRVQRRSVAVPRTRKR